MSGMKISLEQCPHCGGRHTFIPDQIYISNVYSCSCCNDHTHEIIATCPITKKEIVLHEQE